MIVAGHLCLDMLPNMDQIPLNALATPGRLFETGALQFATGGAVSNTGIALHKLGVAVRLIANIGEDFAGTTIRSILDSHSPVLSEHVTVVADQPTSYTIVLSPGRVDRIFLHCPGTNTEFGVKDIDFSVLGDAKMFHLGYPSLLPRLFANDGEELAAILERVKAEGLVTSLDMTLPDRHSPSGQVDWRTIFARAMPHTDIFLPSIEEILFCLRRDDFDVWDGKVLAHLSAGYLSDLADELLTMGAVIVGFKLGEMGMYLKTAASQHFSRLKRLDIQVDEWANRIVWSPAFQVNVVGTTGAGDSAYAGFLASLLKGLTPEAALRWACAVGACNVEAVDSTGGVRSWSETLARLDANWPTRPENLPGY
jgi:sugar/nucleoside kinase (ribokinase family)